MTWHAKAMTTSYLTAPGAADVAATESDDAFPFATTSWFLLDAIDVDASDSTRAVVCFGDSITDGTASTLNGNDRWCDVLSSRLHRLAGRRVSVVNEGIGANRVLGPAEYSAERPFAGGPSALQRLDRDVLALSGVTTVVWLEGINDISNGDSADAIIAGLTEGVTRLHARGIRVIGATITSALGGTTAAASADADARRRRVNDWIRTGGVFDGVADFDRATADPSTGAMRPEFVPNSTIGGPGDHLHPNRAGYQQMGQAIDLQLILK
jgi:lysophospholipase L1-like esterase